MAAETEKLGISEFEHANRELAFHLFGGGALTEQERKMLDPKKLRVGDTVYVKSVNLKGTVLTLPDQKGVLQVRMGILNTKVTVDDLELVDEVTIQAPNLARTGSGKVRLSKSAAVSTEINLLGKTVDEAVSELDKYLDDASLAHLSSVRIIHGKGTGALRKGVHDFLRKNKHVKEYRLAEYCPEQRIPAGLDGNRGRKD